MFFSCSFALKLGEHEMHKELYKMEGQNFYFCQLSD